MSGEVTGDNRLRLSVVGVTGGAGYYEGGISQIYRGVSGMASLDLVDGTLLVAPRIGFTYARAEAERSKSVSVDVKGKAEGWGQPESVSYSVDTERTSADRYTPYVGLALGLMNQERDGGVGVQAIFDLGRDVYTGYEIERYPDQQVSIGAAKGLSLRAGAELLIEPYWFGEHGPGLGIMMGLYWARHLNPLTRGADNNGLEVNVGLLASFE